MGVFFYRRGAKTQMDSKIQMTKGQIPDNIQFAIIKFQKEHNFI